MDMTTRDEQTGLMNLGAFSFVLDHVIRRSSRAGECATVLSIVVPSLPRSAMAKANLGTGLGDAAVVYRVARLLRTELRGEDVVARIGDREFGVALPDTDADGGETVVSWIASQLIEDGLSVGDQSTPSVVIGRSTFDPSCGPIGAAEILKAARESIAGPSHVTGTQAPPAADEPAVIPQGTKARRGDSSEGPTTQRRHLRSLHAHDS